MIKFEVGKTYYARSICDSDCLWKFEVTSRTDKTITLDNFSNKKFRITVLDNEEIIYPLGKYSMCPILKASREMNV